MAEDSTDSFVTFKLSSKKLKQPAAFQKNEGTKRRGFEEETCKTNKTKKLKETYDQMKSNRKAKRNQNQGGIKQEH